MNNSNSMSLLLHGGGSSGVEQIFQSTRGNPIRLGHTKQRTSPEKFDFYPAVTYYSDGTREEHGEWNPVTGLNATKFHQGFQRKLSKDIINPLEEMEKKAHELSKARSLACLALRKDYIKKMESNTNFNILNWQSVEVKDRLVQKEKPSGRKYIVDGLGDEAAVRGSAVLRESLGRFHAPYPCSVKQSYRQDVLLREGLLKPKMAGVLEPGKADHKSFGIDDQFSKSGYTRKSEAAMQGITDCCKPGRYSPDKQRGNPSGNPAIVKNWHKGVSFC